MKLETQCLHEDTLQKWRTRVVPIVQYCAILIRLNTSLDYSICRQNSCIPVSLILLRRCRKKLAALEGGKAALLTQAGRLHLFIVRNICSAGELHRSAGIYRNS